MRVTYHPQTKKMKKVGTIFSARVGNTYFEQNITIRNIRLSRISQLRVSECVPVSNSDKLKINLLEPSMLASNPWQKSTLAQDKVQAHWVKPGGGAQNESEDEASVAAIDLQKAQGLFEWVCEVDPGKSVDLTLAWEVVTPIGMEWSVSL